MHSSSEIFYDLENLLNLITYISLYKDVMLIIQLQLYKARRHNLTI